MLDWDVTNLVGVFDTISLDLTALSASKTHFRKKTTLKKVKKLLPPMLVHLKKYILLLHAY
jgi:hypothetical protein